MHFREPSVTSHRLLGVTFLFVALTSTGAQSTTCTVDTPATTEATWSHWGSDTRNTRHVPRRSGGLTAADVPRLAVKWTHSLGETVNARSQPAVAGGRVFIGSEAGRVVALAASSGCTLWTHKTEMPVRSGVVAQLNDSGVPVSVFFGEVAGFVYGARAAVRRNRRPSPPSMVRCSPGRSTRSSAFRPRPQATRYLTAVHCPGRASGSKAASALALPANAGGSPMRFAPAHGSLWSRSVAGEWRPNWSRSLGGREVGLATRTARWTRGRRNAGDPGSVSYSRSLHRFPPGSPDRS